MYQISTKIRRALAIRGCIETLKLCGMKAIGFVRGLMPACRADRYRARELDKEFDRKYGIETSGIVHPSESTVVGNNWIYGVRYEPVNQTMFVQTIKELSISYEKFVFIDFGSGKGRALLLAAGFPFKRIVGIEYCHDLNRIASKNLTHFPSASKLCKNIDLVSLDAAEYCLPNEPLVFFYNPFGRQVMEKVVQNVIDSFRSCPRRMIIAYLAPKDADLWDRVQFLKRDRSGRAVWDTGPIVEGSPGDC